VEEFGYTHISTGDLFREEVKKVSGFLTDTLRAQRRVP
jgi:adenylate kinase family enzyme